MDAICIKDLKKDLKREMDDSRYEHTLGVMYTSAALAMRYEYDMERAMLAKVKYDIDDEEVLGAIRWHTTGKPNMNLLEKIVYVADYIEPRRDKAPNLKEIRKLAFMDMDLALLKILEDTLGYLGDSPEEVDSMTRETYEYYKAQIKG